MKSFKELKSQISEAHQEVSADFKVTASGRKVPVQRKSVKDTDDNEMNDKEVKEGAVPAHMQGKQKPYVSSDGKGNFEVLGNKGQTKATFSRKEHGTEAQKKAQAHLRSKYDEYMKEDTELEEGVSIHRVSVTVTDPHHPATTMRSKKHEKRVKVKANDREHAIDSALHYYKKKGYKVHDHNYIGTVNEETQIDEAVDKQEQRFLQLARLGLVDKGDVSKLRTAMEQLKADKPLTTQQRTLLLAVTSDLISLVTGDDAIFNRAKMDVRKEDTQLELDEGENKQMKGKDPCWKGYQMVGMKDKNGKKVPNCVPEETEVEEGYVSLAQQRAVWATRKDGGKGHPDNKKKSVKEEKEKDEPPFDPDPPKKNPVATAGKYGQGYSTAKHLARLALQKQQQKAKNK